MKKKKLNKKRKSLRNRYYCMISRCYDEKNKSYCNYGARGITVCKKWKVSFSCFYRWALRNGFKINLTLDRINNDGNYTGQNCRFVTHEGSMINRRNNKLITYNGETKVLSEWCRIFNTDYRRTISRINVLKWSFHKAIITPAGKHTKRKLNRISN